jgi:hypothetical protein
MTSEHMDEPALMWVDPRTERLWAITFSSHDSKEGRRRGRALVTFSAAGETFTAWSEAIGRPEVLTVEQLQTLLDQATSK